MKCAVLCNGPSRILYTPSEDYHFVIGCNIPWAKVDATIILDPEIITYLGNNPDEIKYNIYFGRKAWMYADEIKKRPHFSNYFLGIVDPHYPYYSSGHMAIEVMLKHGYDEIDIYGCDAYYNIDLTSSTHQYVNTSDTKGISKCIKEWRKKWQAFIDNNPKVKFNFIK